MLRPSLQVEHASNVQARKLWALMKQLKSEGKFSHTFGALDPVQVVQMAPHVSTIYVSGWQYSSTASTRSVSHVCRVAAPSVRFCWLHAMLVT